MKHEFFFQRFFFQLKFAVLFTALLGAGLRPAFCQKPPTDWRARQFYVLPIGNSRLVKGNLDFVSDTAVGIRVAEGGQRVFSYSQIDVIQWRKKAHSDHGFGILVGTVGGFLTGVLVGELAVPQCKPNEFLCLHGAAVTMCGILGGLAGGITLGAVGLPSAKIYFPIEGKSKRMQEFHANFSL